LAFVSRSSFVAGLELPICGNFKNFGLKWLPDKPGWMSFHRGKLPVIKAFRQSRPLSV
jgi:hypothetical protein